MAKHKEDKPLGDWRLEREGEYFTDFVWECPFCGKIERYGFSKGHQGKYEDSLYDHYRCWHCGKDADGNTELILYREGDCGYYGDGDFEWNGSWKGEKKVLVHRPFDFDRIGCYGEDRIPSDRPDINLHVYAWTSGGGWVDLPDGSYRRKRRRIQAYSATLKFGHWWGHTVQVVHAKRVKTLKQVYAEVAALDLTPYLPEMLRSYYDKHHVRCVWKLEDNRWVPYMTSYGEIDSLGLPYGTYAVWEPRWGRHSKIVRGSYGSSGSGFRPEDDLPQPPTPWHVDYIEPVTIHTDTAEVTKQLDSA